MQLSLYLLILMFISIFIFLLIPYFKKINNYFELMNQKISTPAILTYKLIEFSGDKSKFILVFELYTGKKIKFEVNHIKYSLYCKGDKGILTYCGDRFINFKKKY